MTTETPALTSYFSIIGRRKWLLLLAVLAILGASAALAFGLPAVYRSDSTILIEQQGIPQELVPSTITTFADQRIQLISQRIMTRDNLLGVIDKFDLYAEDRKSRSTESLITRMRKDINMETVSADVIDPRSGRPVSATIAFTLAYDNRAPELAQLVSQELVKLFLDENVKSRTETAAETSDFLSEEAERLRATIGDLENRIADFKAANSEALPELAELNMQLMDRAQQEITESERQIRSLEERKIFLDSELAQTPRAASQWELRSRRAGESADPNERLQALRTEYLTVSSVYGPRHPDLIRLTQEIEALERGLGVTTTSRDLRDELSFARGELDGARQRYSESHPDVIRLQRRVTDLEKRVGSATTRTSRAPANPAYARLQAEAKAVGSQLTSLYAKKEDLKQRVLGYEQRLTQTPQVERTYRALLRDQENAIAKFKEIQSKQGQAQLAQTLESERKGERFTLIESPQLPEEPIKPHRMGILLLGLLFSMAGGLGAVSLAERLDDTVRDRSDLASMSGLPTLATVPYLPGAGDGMRKFGVGGAVSLGAIAAVGVCAYLLHNHVMPLGELWTATLERFKH